MEVLRVVQEIDFEIFFQCREINHLTLKFSEKNTSLACYSRAITALEIC